MNTDQHSIVGLRGAALRVLEPARALLIVFSAVTLGTSEFIINALTSEDVLPIAAGPLVIVILAVIVIPTALLFAVDRVLASGVGSEKGLRIFRTALFVASAALILRQIQLYYGSARQLSEALESAHPLILLGVMVLVLAAVTRFCVRAYRGVSLFFLYASPVAILLLAILPYRGSVSDPLPDYYINEVQRPAEAQSAPPVFVIVFDELSYDVLLRDGEIDEDRFPNFAALAADSALFTNASTNYFHTTFALPSLIDQIKPLTDSFEMRMYLQYDYAERSYQADCGVVFTCRGVRRLSEQQSDQLVANLVLRTVYGPVPDLFGQALDRPAGLVVDSLRTSYPSADERGLHLFSKDHFDTFLGDIRVGESEGRIYLFHSMLPHYPFVFDETGNAHNSSANSFWADNSSFDAVYQNYRQQVGFSDSLLGDFLDRLERESLYDDAVIVVTADHGMRPIQPVGSSAIDVDRRTAQVPLLIRAPNLEPRVLDVDYQHIDFGATLTDVLGMPAPSESSGISAFAGERPEREKVFYVDYRNRMYWTYVYSEEEGAWEVRDVTEGPLG
jgi:hypothetical protein